MSDSDHAPRISEILDAISGSKRKTVSVQDVLEAFGDRAFGALLFVFAAPVALPMPPGVSAILGAPLLFITAQLMVGRRTLWLPKALAERTMTRADFVTLMGKVSPYLTWLERRLKPRFTFLYNPWLDRVTGLLCLVLAIIVFCRSRSETCCRRWRSAPSASASQSATAWWACSAASWRWSASSCWRCCPRP
jgi:hypothetical protein